MKKGLFITFEGPDGSGKTTQIQKLKEYLMEKNCDVVLTREPGGTAISEKIRTLLLDKGNKEMAAVTEMLLYAAARAQHVSEVIAPNLNSGKIVICDRFVDSSIVYQGFGRNLGDVVQAVNDIAVDGCIPDTTFFINLDPAIGKKRIEVEGEFDRLELEKLEYHNKVYQGYLVLAEKYPKRIISIDGNRNIDAISKDIIENVDRLLAMKRND